MYDVVIKKAISIMDNMLQLSAVKIHLLNLQLIFLATEQMLRLCIEVKLSVKVLNHPCY